MAFRYQTVGALGMSRSITGCHDVTCAAPIGDDSLGTTRCVHTGAVKHPRHICKRSKQVRSAGLDRGGPSYSYALSLPLSNYSVCQSCLLIEARALGSWYDVTRFLGLLKAGLKPAERCDSSTSAMENLDKLTAAGLPVYDLNVENVEKKDW
jgi:hypothetical protein